MKSRKSAEGLWNRKLMAILGGIVVLLVFGEFTRQMNIRDRRGRPVSYLEAIRLGLIKDQLASIKLATNPWTISPLTLDRDRVIYNLITKSGFSELGWMLLMTIVLLYAGFTAVSYAFQWQWHQLKSINRVQVRIEIAGTVTIGAKRGVIYVYGKEDNPAKENVEVYAFKWLPVAVRVEYRVQ